MSHFKILILGDPAVGKSCFLVRYADNVFTNAYMSTIGMDYKFKNVELEDGREYDSTSNMGYSRSRAFSDYNKKFI